MLLLPLAFLGLGSGMFGGRKRYTPEEKAMLAALLAQSMRQQEEEAPVRENERATRGRRR